MGRREPILAQNRADAARRWLRRRFASSPDPEVAPVEGGFLRKTLGRRRVRGLPLLVAAGAAWMLYSLIWGTHGLVEILESPEERARLASEAALLGEEIDTIKDGLARSERDPLHHERLAREAYGLARNDEIVYRIGEESRAVTVNDEKATSTP